MPSILFRYLARQVLQIAFAVTGIVLLIIMSGRFVNYLAEAARGTMSPKFLFSVMGYRIPEFLIMIIPLSLFLGVIMGYGRLYVDHEMTVMKACGVSQRQVLGMTMIPALLVALLVAGMSLYIAPSGVQEVELILSQQKSMTEFDTLIAGRFQKFGRGSRVTYTESLTDSNKQMNRVFIANSSSDPKSSRMSLVMAEKGRISTLEENGPRYLILSDGYRYDLSPGAQDVRITQYDTYAVRMEESKEAQQITKEKALPTDRLLMLNTIEGVAEWQWRLSLPLVIPIIMLMAVPLAKVNPRQGRFVNLLPGILIYLVYLALLMTGKSMIEDGRLPTFPGLWLIHGCFLILALLIYFKDALKSLVTGRKVHA